HQVRFNFASRGKAMNRFLTIATATLAFCGLAFSQTATGVIQGHVLDTTGSAIPGATVKSRNQKTGVQNSTTSNMQGSFLLPYLLPGEYSLTVEKPGLDKSVTPYIRLTVHHTNALTVTIKSPEIS